MKAWTSFVDQKISSTLELKEIYRRLLEQLPARSLLLLMGPMGVGKTTSVQLFTELLGLEPASSPSFAIHHRYQNSQGLTLDHLDLYRLLDDEDLESTGFWDLFAQEKSIIAIEWADRLDLSLLPLNWFQVRIHLSKTAIASERHLQVDIEKI